jgi:hypothetical protein
MGNSVEIRIVQSELTERQTLSLNDLRLHYSSIREVPLRHYKTLDRFRRPIVYCRDALCGME